MKTISINKVITILLLVFYVITLMPTLAKAETTETYGYLSYIITYNEVTITDCDEDATGEIAIPSEIDGYPVTTIGDNAFEWCWGINSILLPESITHIGILAFYGSNITSIHVPENVSSIRSQAFSGCVNLTTITVSEHNNNFSSDGIALYNKDKTILLSVPCATTTYEVPQGVVIIGPWAFSENLHLISVSLSNTVTHIRNNAFEKCTYLKNITFSKNLITIDDFAFLGCIELSNLKFPSTLVSIGWYTFSDCNKLEEIALPDNLTSLEAYSFANCSSLYNVILPNSISNIPEKAFANCDSLTTIILPNNVTSMGDKVFNNCDNLKTVYAHISSDYKGDWLGDCPATIKHYCTVQYMLSDEVMHSDMVIYGTDAILPVAPKNHIYTFTQNGVEWDGKNITADATITVTKTPAYTTFVQPQINMENSRIEYSIKLLSEGTSGLDGIFLIAFYNSDNTFIGAQGNVLDTTEHTYNILGTYETLQSPVYCKVFFWDKAMFPICESQTINI